MDLLSCWLRFLEVDNFFFQSLSFLKFDQSLIFFDVIVEKFVENWNGLWSFWKFLLVFSFQIFNILILFVESFNFFLITAIIYIIFRTLLKSLAIFLVATNTWIIWIFNFIIEFIILYIIYIIIKFLLILLSVQFLGIKLFLFTKNLFSCSLIIAIWWKLHLSCVLTQFSGKMFKIVNRIIFFFKIILFQFLEH